MKTNSGVIKMRDIKFRAWDKKKKEFWHDFRISPFGHIEPATSSKNGLWIYDFKYNQKNVVLVQYTGLKDKNGKEIYEGDLVKWNGWSKKAQIDIFGKKRKHKISEVVWINKTGAWELKGNEDWNITVYDEIEIIGNIYKNPELIK